MQAYIILHKDVDLSIFGKNVDFSRFADHTYLSLDDAIEQIEKPDFFIAQIEFTNDEDILECIKSACLGYANKILHIKLIKTITIKAND